MIAPVVTSLASGAYGGVTASLYGDFPPARRAGGA
jgi:hypothetical protein